MCMKRHAYIEVNIPVTIFKEDKKFVAYTTALDLSTSGKTYKEAEKRFDEIVEIFFEEITKKGTLKQVLTELGWEKAKKAGWSPPLFVSQALRPARLSYA